MSFPTSSLNILGSFVFELCCEQTDKQTDSKILPTPTDKVGVGNDPRRCFKQQTRTHTRFIQPKRLAARNGVNHIDGHMRDRVTDVTDRRNTDKQANKRWTYREIHEHIDTKNLINNIWIVKRPSVYLDLVAILMLLAVLFYLCNQYVCAF